MHQNILLFPGGAGGTESVCQRRRLMRHEFAPGLGGFPGEGNGAHFSILAERIPWTGKPPAL